MNTNRLLNKIDIPKYSLKQELFNSVSHFIGVPLSIFVLVISTTLFLTSNINLSNFIGLLVFAFTIAALYLMSGIYHFEDPTNEKKKKIKRVADHCTIYLLIAGTYTPICIYISSFSNLGFIILSIEWVLAIVGALINVIDFTNKIVKGVSMFLYLALGWLIIFSGAFVYLSTFPFAFILIGGILYTIGSILYGVGHKNLTFHSVFHVFVLLGTIFQTIGVLSLFI